MSNRNVAARALLLLAAVIGIIYNGLYGWIVLALIISAILLLSDFDDKN